MSESIPGAADPDPNPADDSPAAGSHASAPVHPAMKASLLLRMGGWLGVLSSSLAMLIFLLGCFGADRLFARMGLSSVFGLAIAPLLLSVPGLLLSIAGGARRTSTAIDPNVLAALFVNILGLSGALVEIVVWRQWGLFYSSGGGA